MDFIGAFTCNFTCWNCPKQCPMKTNMEELPDDIFNQSIIESAKANAGIRIASGWSVQQAEHFVKEMCVTIFLAKQKYLETLK